MEIETKWLSTAISQITLRTEWFETTTFILITNLQYGQGLGRAGMSLPSPASSQTGVYNYLKLVTPVASSWSGQTKTMGGKRSWGSPDTCLYLCVAFQVMFSVWQPWRSWTYM